MTKPDLSELFLCRLSWDWLVYTTVWQVYLGSEKIYNLQGLPTNLLKCDSIEWVEPWVSEDCPYYPINNYLRGIISEKYDLPTIYTFLLTDIGSNVYHGSPIHVFYFFRYRTLIKLLKHISHIKLDMKWSQVKMPALECPLGTDCTKGPDAASGRLMM